MCFSKKYINLKRKTIHINGILFLYWWSLAEYRLKGKHGDLMKCLQVIAGLNIYFQNRRAIVFLGGCIIPVIWPFLIPFITSCEWIEEYFGGSRKPGKLHVFLWWSRMVLPSHKAAGKEVLRHSMCRGNFLLFSHSVPVSSLEYFFLNVLSLTLSFSGLAQGLYTQ